MSKRLAPNAHLDHLKKQAKDLLKAHRAGEPQAYQRLKAHLHRLSRASEEDLRTIKVTLQEAQFITAREYGFDNWSDLVAEFDSTPSPSSQILIAEGWTAGNSHEYEMGGDPTARHGTDACGFIFSKLPAQLAAATFGTLRNQMEPGNHRGKRLRMSGYVKTEEVEGWVGLWMRVDGESNQMLSFDNMQRRAIQGTTDWQRYEVVLDVPEEGTNIAFGILLSGKGKAWIGDLQFERVGEEVPVTQIVLEYEADPEIEAKIEAGSLLVATPKIEDPNFTRTVIFVSHHDERSTLGFIINRPLDEQDERWNYEGIRLIPNPELPEGLWDVPREVFYHGGPMEMLRLFPWHRLESTIEGSAETGPDLYQGGDWQALLEQTRKQDTPSSYLRFFLGHAGWGRGQLSAEIANGVWHLFPSSRERVGQIFSSSPETLWQEMIDTVKEDDQ